MKILHTVALYHPSVGGSEEVVRQLSEQLVRRGHQVTVATAHNPARRNLRINGVEIVEFNITGNWALGMRGELERYRRFVERCKPDVMMNYASACWTTDVVLPLLKKISARKIFVPCGYLLNDPRFAGYYRQLPLFLPTYDAIVYMSANYQDKLFGDRHGVGDLAAIIPNAASQEEFLRPPLGFRKKFGINTKYVLLCVANHYPAKGHAFVLRAFQRLRRRDATLVIIGNPLPPPQKSCSWRCRIETIFRSRIKMLAAVPRPWVVSAFQEADLFVFGSQLECAPLVILESMAARIPYVSTDCGNVRDYQQFGIVVDRPEAMAEGIKKFLDDDSWRKTVGVNASRYWRKFHTWETIANQYEQLYREPVKTLNGLHDAVNGDNRGAARAAPPLAGL